MKNFLIAQLFGCLIVFASCSKPKPMEKVIDDALSFSVKQYTLMADVMKDKSDLLPRTLDTTGKLVTAKSNWWTSGFFPGSLWYLYQYSKDEKIKEYAAMMTSRIEKEKNNKGTHDLGFMLYCSFGNGLRLTGNDSYNELCLQGQNLFLPVSGPILDVSSRGTAEEAGNAR